jgi:NAD-dependent SIR2 family protein deacetylase
MENPKTTVSGILGALGSVLLAVGTAFQSKPWAQTLMVVGAGLSGSSGVGTFFARDATGKIQRKPR